MGIEPELRFKEDEVRDPERNSGVDEDCGAGAESLHVSALTLSLPDTASFDGFFVGDWKISKSFPPV